jgi:HEAT repeat protein
MKSNLSALISALSNVDPTSRMQAAEQLTRLGSVAQPAAVALVLACGDEAEDVRKAAVSALEKIGPPEAADLGQLIALIEAKSPDVGCWATTLLGRLKSEAAPAVDALVRAIAESPHILVRQRAAWALGEIGAPADAALPTLRRVVSDPDPCLARLAYEAVRQIGEQ